MSIKIYNGYCIPNCKKEDFQKVCDTLRSKTRDLISHDFEVLYQKLFTETIQKLMVEDYKVGYGKDKGQAAEEIKNKLWELDTLQRGYSYYQKQFSNQPQAPSIYQLYEDSKKYPAFHSLEYQIYDCLLVKKDFAIINRHISPYDALTGSIGFFPIKDKVLLLGYGACNQVLEEMVREGNELGIVEYSFWNNTDCPEHITEEEWEQRGEDWKTALPDWVPVNSGVFLEVGKDNFLFLEMYRNIIKNHQEGKSLCDFAKIQKKAAREIYFEEQLAKSPSLYENNVSDFVDDCHEKKKKIYASWNETEVLKISKRLPKLPEGKDVFSCTVFDFIPNYMEKYLYPLEKFISDGGK